MCPTIEAMNRMDRMDRGSAHLVAYSQQDCLANNPENPAECPPSLGEPSTNRANRFSQGTPEAALHQLEGRSSEREPSQPERDPSPPAAEAREDSFANRVRSLVSWVRSLF